MATTPFNTFNCVAIPRNPVSKLPMPSYERLSESPGTEAIKSESPEMEDTAYASEEDDNTGIRKQHPASSAFQMSVMESQMLTECENCDEGFYEKLTTLKQQNIFHLQELESQMKGFTEKKKPLFVLDMPCYCKDATEPPLSRHEELSFDENDESLEEQINALFEGVSDNETDNEFELKHKPVKRVQSAPPAKFKPTEIKPFGMTLREEVKAKEKAILKEMLQNNQNTGDELELDEQFIFKAKPVPSHVKKPLFGQMARKNPSRFHFLNKKELKRATSMPSNLNNENNFKARPFPKEIFTDYAYEQMKENEKYRDMRKSLRQKTLLSNSHWPARMGKELEAPKMKKASQAKTEKQVVYKPSIVPDFDKSYKRFLRMMQQKKMSKPSTVIQPFSFDDQIDVSFLSVISVRHLII